MESPDGAHPSRGGGRIRPVGFEGSLRGATDADSQFGQRGGGDCSGEASQVPELSAAMYASFGESNAKAFVEREVD
ncbi:hypothetical protein BV898_02222 [Hypsibius exemplaris]|uniref:Uncharacterized protein n=1 Tax=Hypsibius exemplaris TaxID=2072580 RepID=A0A1W0X8P8_HYPEX|nr:hypothetical protein BV898_02222 [Hypsibius exemplaris]